VNDRRREKRINRRLARFSLGAKHELLQVLSCPSHVRANLIGRMYERPDTRGLAEVLMDLEAEPHMRTSAVEVLVRSLRKTP
jgi:hypothetical protein